MQSRTSFSSTVPTELEAQVAQFFGAAKPVGFDRAELLWFIQEHFDRDGLMADVAEHFGPAYITHPHGCIDQIRRFIHDLGSDGIDRLLGQLVPA